MPNYLSPTPYPLSPVPSRRVETPHHSVANASASAREPEPTGSTQPEQALDAMMLQRLDFSPTCGTNACKASPNPAAYAVRWVRHLQPRLGYDVTLLCASCFREGVAVMSKCNSGVLWRIVEVLR